MRLSRSAAIRFAVERILVGIGDTWQAIATVIGIALFGIISLQFMTAGRVTVEPAAVLGFGIYEDQVGSHPIVRVRLSDGGVAEIPTSTSVVHGCREGSRIWILRRPHMLSVDPRGCPPGFG
jgi:hypothetical protein